MPGLGPPTHDKIMENFFDPGNATRRIVQSFEDIPSAGRATLGEEQPNRNIMLSVAINGFLEEFKSRTEGLHDPDAITQVLANMLRELQLVFEAETPANILVDDRLPSVDENIYSGLPPAGTPTANLSLYIRRE